ncbi:histidine-containing phosphotransfer protein 4-like isoform X2 [Phaseolus vulgaris]|uniref:histidine-containing phosphotransfer protein 4-like isoform X2 n=1 Tax=Phaseolus vulgaris TaxID=3885 RepID=UPI0035CC278F
MDRNQSRRQVAAMKQSLFDQGLLDEQFIQLEELQDDANPNFVEEIVTLHYRDSSRLISSIEQALKERNPLDFNKLDTLMHQFKGSSSSIGAKKVKAECNLFREYCRVGNAEGCMRSFQQLKKEYAALRKKLEAYFQQCCLFGAVGKASWTTRNSMSLQIKY